MSLFFTKPEVDNDTSQHVKPITIRDLATDMSKTPLYKNNVSYLEGMFLKTPFMSDEKKLKYMDSKTGLVTKATLAGLNVANSISKDYGASKNARDLYHNVYKVDNPFGGKKKRTKKSSQFKNRKNIKKRKTKKAKKQIYKKLK